MPEDSHRNLIVREANLSDSEALYELASHPDIRKTTFNPAPFSFESHQDWYRKKLADPNYKIFLVCDGALVQGYVRYEKTKDECLVHIAVHPRVWGKGIGTFALQESLKFVPHEWNCRKIKAQVLKTNAGSLRIFEKAGYQIEGGDSVLDLYRKVD